MFSALSRAKECNPNVRLCETGLRLSSDGSLISSSPRDTRMLWHARNWSVLAGVSPLRPELGGTIGGLCMGILIDRFGLKVLVAVFALAVPVLVFTGTPGISDSLPLVMAQQART